MLRSQCGLLTTSPARIMFLIVLMCTVNAKFDGRFGLLLFTHTVLRGLSAFLPIVLITDILIDICTREIHTRQRCCFVASVRH